MKKKFVLASLLFAFIMCIMPNVYAAYEFDKDNPTQKEQIEKIGGNGTKEAPYELKLKTDAIQDFHIKKEANIHVVIDLAGHKLTNYTDNNSVIFIEDPNSSVTIKDSSNGKGVIELNTDKAITNDVPVINNVGTLIVGGGIINSNNNSGQRSTGIYNTGNLTITGGNIITTSDTAWGITNLGTAVINGGTFNQNKKLPMIQNSADLTINNGEFIANGAEGQEAMIVNDPGDLGHEGNVIAKIVGGDFQTQNVIYEEGKAITEISGGTYANPDSIVKYLANGYELKNGKVVKVEQPVAPAEAKNNTKNPNTSDSIIYSVIAITISSIGIAFAYKKLHD